MRRLLQLVTIFFVISALIIPLVECFDTWDAEGLENDTELPLFLVFLFIALTFVVARLIAVSSLIRQLGRRYLPWPSVLRQGPESLPSAIVLPPPIFSPLRI